MSELNQTRPEVIRCLFCRKHGTRECAVAQLEIELPPTLVQGAWPWECLYNLNNEQHITDSFDPSKIRTSMDINGRPSLALNCGGCPKAQCRGGGYGCGNMDGKHLGTFCAYGIRLVEATIHPYRPYAMAYYRPNGTCFELDPNYDTIMFGTPLCEGIDHLIKLSSGKLEKFSQATGIFTMGDLFQHRPSEILADLRKIGVRKPTWLKPPRIQDRTDFNGPSYPDYTELFRVDVEKDEFFICKPDTDYTNQVEKEQRAAEAAKRKVEKEERARKRAAAKLEREAKRKASEAKREVAEKIREAKQKEFEEFVKRNCANVFNTYFAILKGDNRGRYLRVCGGDTDYTGGVEGAEPKVPHTTDVLRIEVKLHPTDHWTVGRSKEVTLAEMVDMIKNEVIRLHTRP